MRVSRGVSVVAARGRRSLPRVAGLLLTLVALPAWGQEAATPSGGTVGYKVAQQARTTNATLYGAAAAFENNVKPAIQYGDGALVRLEVHNLLRAVTIAGSCDYDLWDECNGHAYVKLPVDLFASTFSFAYRAERVGVFYTSSMTMASVPSWQSPGVTRGLANAAAFTTPLVPAIRPIEKAATVAENEDLPATAFVLGASYDVGPFNAYAGYQSSRGLFTNVTEDRLRAFFTGIVGNELRELTYLKAGLDRTPWLGLGEDVARLVGFSTATVREVSVTIPHRVAPGGLDDLVAYRRAAAYNWWTTHLEQASIARIVDVGGALSVWPVAAPFEGHLSVHTPRFRAPLLDPDTSVSELFSTEDFRVDAGATVGIVNLPDLAYLGQRGGQQPMFRFDVKIPFASLSVQHNTPDILTAFPYAYGAWSVVWMVGSSTGERAAEEEWFE